MKLGKYILISDKLTGEYKKAFEYIESYAGKHMVSGSYKNEKMMDILDILLTAQEEKTDIIRIVGTDLQQFSKDFFSDMTLIHMLEPFFSKICYWAWVILILEGINLLIMSQLSDFNLFTAKSDISGFLTGVQLALVGQLLVEAVSIVLVKINKYSNKKYFIMFITITVVAICAAIVLSRAHYELAVPVFSMILIAIGYLAGYYVCKMLYRYAKTGSIQIAKNEYDASFTALVKEEIGKTDYDA